MNTAPFEKGQRVIAPKSPTNFGTVTDVTPFESNDGTDDLYWIYIAYDGRNGFGLRLCDDDLTLYYDQPAKPTTTTCDHQWQHIFGNQEVRLNRCMNCGVYDMIDKRTSAAYLCQKASNSHLQMGRNKHHDHRYSSSYRHYRRSDQ